LPLSPQRPQPLRAFKANAQALATSITSTAALSERVSRKVRQLDVAQSRVNRTLTHITATVGRTDAVDGLRRALAADDFEGAAAHIAQFRDLEARFVSGAASDDRQMQEQHEAVASARTQLAGTIHSRLEVASRVGDHDAVDRFIRLYKPLDMEVRGAVYALGRWAEQDGVWKRAPASGGASERGGAGAPLVLAPALPQSSPFLPLPAPSPHPRRKAWPGFRPTCGAWWRTGRRRRTRPCWRVRAPLAVCPSSTR